MGDNQNNRRGSNRQAAARREARRASREAVMALLFETEFHEDESAEAIYTRAVETRTVDTADREGHYIRAAYMGIMENLPAIDALIGRHATGWRTGRLSRVSRAVLRLGVYELAFDEKIPAPIAINEAVELSKKYDDPKARAFVNGVLNAVKNELMENEGRLPADLLAETAAPAESEPELEVEIIAEPATPAATDESL